MKTKTLFTRARESDLTILTEDLNKLREIKKDATPLHWLATKASTLKIIKDMANIIQHPLIAEVTSTIKRSGKYFKYMQGYHYGWTRGEDEDSNVPEEISGITPLHLLASKGIKETLQHPLVGIVQDSHGNTPLHLLASSSQGRSNDCQEPLWKLLFKHPDFHKVKNKDNKTPLECFNVKKHPLLVKTIRNFLTYVPKHYTDNQRVTKEIWRELMSVPNSIKYILED